MKSYKVDLHCHSSASPDGGLSQADFKRALSSGLLDMIAVTDHNLIDFALSLQKQLGNRIIVGEEIMTTSGEIIGLFLKKVVPSGLPISRTVDLIAKQGGVVIAPHPFETFRKGLGVKALEEIAPRIDAVEAINGRALFQNRSAQASEWADENSLPKIANSDAHGWRGFGETYSLFPVLPNPANFRRVAADTKLISTRARLRAVLYPKYHRVRKKFMGKTK